MTRITILLVALLISLLSGCSSTLNPAGSGEFSCPGMPGVMCKTPGQVYRMTEGDRLDPSALEPKTVSVKRVNPAVSINDANTPMPIREPAKVMRIWIAPFTDKNDDLHWPSYVYTEIQERKWSFGNPDFKEMNPVVPYKNLSAGYAAQPSATSKTKQAAPQSSVALPSTSENP
jgi:conjugal transfer pilus assembly protein TraV